MPEKIEYSYFRLEGRSLTALARMREADAEIEELCNDLAGRYGAELFVPETKNFVYRAEEEVPAEFDIFRIQRRSNGSVHVVCARPVAGSGPEGIMNSVLLVLQDAFQRRTLEGAFACGEMPMKKEPHGNFCHAFVRASQKRNIEDPANEGRKGYNDTTQAFLASDNLAWGEFLGKKYLRVPNDENGKPRFMPPDAVLIPYEDMLRIDKADHEERLRHPLMGGRGLKL